MTCSTTPYLLMQLLFNVIWLYRGAFLLRTVLRQTLGSFFLRIPPIIWNESGSHDNSNSSGVYTCIYICIHMYISVPLARQGFKPLRIFNLLEKSLGGSRKGVLLWRASCFPNAARTKPKSKAGTKCVSSPWHLSSIEYPSAEADWTHCVFIMDTDNGLSSICWHN